MSERGYSDIRFSRRRIVWVAPWVGAAGLATVLLSGRGRKGLESQAKESLDLGQEHHQILPDPKIIPTSEAALLDEKLPPLDICLRWPVHGPLSSPIGPSHPLGIDIDKFNSAGEPVLAAAGGKVAFAGGDSCCGYGLYTVVNHGRGIFTLYGHLSKVGVKVEQEIASGQPLGNVGNTGYSTGTHLHFELRRLKDLSLEGKLLPVARTGFESHLNDYFHFYNPVVYLAPGVLGGRC